MTRCATGIQFVSKQFTNRPDFRRLHPDLSDPKSNFSSAKLQMRRDRALCEKVQQQRKEEEERGKILVAGTEKKENTSTLKAEKDDSGNDDFYSIIERAQAIEPKATDIWSGTSRCSSSNHANSSPKSAGAAKMPSPAPDKFRSAGTSSILQSISAESCTVDLLVLQVIRLSKQKTRASECQG